MRMRMRMRMHPRPSRIAALVGGLVFCFTGLLAWGGEEEIAPAEFTSLHWPAIDGAEHYTVRLWSGYRLLMEESSRDTLFEVDLNLRRTAAAFDSLSLEVVGLEGWDEEAREMGRQRIRLRP